MLPRKLTGQDPENDRCRYKIVRADTMQDLPGTILSADVDSGICVLMQSDGSAQHFSFGAGGLVIITRVVVLAAVLTLGLSACSQIGKFTEGDLANAAALATAGGDAVGVQCWNGLAPAATSSPKPQTDGIAVVAERDRLLHAAIEGPCGAVVAPALLGLLGKAIPIPF